MASIPNLNIPDELYSHLAKRASRNGRTVEDEVLACVDTAVNRRVGRDNIESVIADLDRFRSSLGTLYITEDELKRAKDEGRP